MKNKCQSVVSKLCPVGLHSALCVLAAADGSQLREGERRIKMTTLLCNRLQNNVTLAALILSPDYTEGQRATFIL